MTRYQINEEVELTVEREDANFDRACDSAMKGAVGMFGADQQDSYGCFLYVEGAVQSTASIEVRFVDYRATKRLGVWNHYYRFKAKVVQ